MPEIIFNSLREANVARDVEWTKGESVADYTWRGCELGGEFGEIVELLVARHAFDALPALAEELADGVICIDLVGMTMGFEPIPIFAAGSMPVGGLRDEATRLATYALLLLNSIKKMERERRGWVGSRAEPAKVEDALHFLMGRLGTIAGYCRINLTAATEAKFNATSIKNGLVTRLYYAPSAGRL